MDLTKLRMYIEGKPLNDAIMTLEKERENLLTTSLGFMNKRSIKTFFVTTELKITCLFRAKIVRAFTFKCIV